MSDTITPDERDFIRNHLEDLPFIDDGPLLVVRLLDALEQAEARAENAEKELAGADAEIVELRDELEDSRGTEKDAPNILCAIARLVGVYEHSQEIGDDMGEMTLDAARDLLADKQTAEAKVARLTKELDGLAGRELTVDGFAAPCQCESDYFQGKKAPCGERPDEFCPKFNHRGNGACWVEAASRAVAAGEG